MMVDHTTHLRPAKCGSIVSVLLVQASGLGFRVPGDLVGSAVCCGAARGAEKCSLILYPRSGNTFLFQYADVFADEVERFLEP